MRTSPIAVLSKSQRRRELRQTYWRQFKENWHIFARERLAILGLLILLIFVSFPIIYPVLRNTVWSATGIYDPLVGFDVAFAPHPAPPSWLPASSLAPGNPHQFDATRPSNAHLLGTDTLGRDVLSVLMASTLPTLTVGLTAAFVTALISIIVACFSAYYRGWLDAILSRISDAFLLLPAPIFMIGVGAFLRSESTSIFELAFIALGGVPFGETAQLILPPLEFGIIYGIIAGFGSGSAVLRSHALRVMGQTFIEASIVAGASARHIIFQHLVRHVAPLAAIYMLVAVTGAIVADGFLAFVGFNPTLLNWGTMVYYAFAYRVVNATIPWNAILAPALMLSLFAASFYMISRGLHAVIEPRLRDLTK